MLVGVVGKVKRKGILIKIFQKWYTYGIIALALPIIFLILAYTKECTGGWDSDCFGYFLLAGLFNWFIDISFGEGWVGFVLYLLSGMFQYFIIGSVVGIIITRIMKLIK